MLVHDGIYKWEGWGGTLRLGSGCCRLRIFHLKSVPGGQLIHLRPLVVLVSDVPDSKMSIRSCAGHIATGVARKFGLEHQRMLYVEYYPATVYGEHREHVIAEVFEAVEFEWHDDMAIHPRWRALKSPLREMLNEMIAKSP